MQLRGLNPDTLGGSIFVGLGIFYGTYAWRTLPIGESFIMGPGYFPVVLSAGLVLLGLATTVRGLSVPESGNGRPIPWRAVVMLPGSVVAFAVLLRPIGFLPTVFLCTVIAGLSSRQLAWIRLPVIAAGIAAFCTMVFLYGVGLPVPLLGPWLKW